jgi:hypothetical protein
MAHLAGAADPKAAATIIVDIHLVHNEVNVHDNEERPLGAGGGGQGGRGWGGWG